ncbi:MAG: NnrS family protein [Rhodocyclaceae bacterium]|nr:MAG: NnrS family protein [Rhodocyclaceae bacterium]
MNVLMSLQEPSSAPQRPSWHAFLSMGFRPFYLLGAIQAALFVLAWAFGFNGTDALPGMFWHGHEMIWGFAGAIIVGFLHTAVANWTGQPPLHGRELATLVVLWLAARIAGACPLLPAVVEALLNSVFLLLAAAYLARSLIRAKQTQNYFVPFLLVGFAASHLAFHLALEGRIAADPRTVLHTGVLVVSAVIFFMGMRILSFFTSRAVMGQQVVNSGGLMLAVILLPLLMAAGLIAGTPAPWLAFFALTTAALNAWSLARWWDKRALQHPMLWVLYAGYACTTLGVGLYGIALTVWPAGISAALHCVTVGGIGLLTLGMMTRTALGHTGRPLVLPRSMVVAYGFMLAATALRLLAALIPVFYKGGIHTASLCFAIGFGLFAWQYGPWLIRPRADGKPW